MEHASKLLASYLQCPFYNLLTLLTTIWQVLQNIYIRNEGLCTLLKVCGLTFDQVPVQEFSTMIIDTELQLI